MRTEANMPPISAALKVIYLPPTSLRPHPQNPRVHSDKQVLQIAKSIEAFGFNVPILVDDKQNVVAGHGRLLAARKLGWKTVPVIKLNHLSESQYAAFLIADNRLTDPPYNVVIDGHASGLWKARHREFAMASGEMSSGEFAEFLRVWGVDESLRLGEEQRRYG
jgi:hypothetical protein